MLVSDAQRAALADLLLDLEAPLFGVGVLHTRVHCREIDQNPGGKSCARQNVREHRRSGLGRGQAHANLACAGQVRRVPARQKRVRERAQRDAVIEQPVAAANHSAPRFERRPGETGARRDVVPVGYDGFQELQIVAHADVQGEPRARLPLILGIETDIRIGLGDKSIPERLRESRVVIGPGQEVGERRESVAAADRPRKGDRAIVVEEVRSRAQGVRSRLVRHVIGHLVQLVEPPRGGSRQRAERGDARNAHRRSDRIGR